MKNIKKAKIEIEQLEIANDEALEAIGKDSPEWRELFQQKKKQISELKKQEFLMACVLNWQRKNIINDFTDMEFEMDDINVENVLTKESKKNQQRVNKILR